jgi:hypothetical protein
MGNYITSLKLYKQRSFSAEKWIVSQIHLIVKTICIWLTYIGAELLL